MIRLTVQDLLAARGWSQLRLAREAGLRPATVFYLFHDTVRSVRLETLDRLCTALGVEPGALFERVPPPRPARRRGNRHGHGK